MRTHEGMRTHEEHEKVGVTSANPDRCTNGHRCSAHDAAHHHGPGCGHEAVAHGNHTDYLVEGHLHHQHKGHCDNHGRMEET